MPFGEELFPPTGGRAVARGYSTGDGGRQQFTAKERDVETGLDYFLARYYSPMQGRFTSPDEFKGGPVELFVRTGDSKKQALPYVEINNPCRYVDPDGEVEPQSLNKYTYVYERLQDLRQDKSASVWLLSLRRHLSLPASPGRGDGRGPNGQGGTSRIEVRIAVDLSQGTVTKTDETMGRSGVFIADLGPKRRGWSSGQQS